MVIQDSTRVSLLWNDESAFGIDPGDGDANWNEIFITGESLKPDLTLSRSQEIRNSRGVSSLDLSDKAVTGSTNHYFHIPTASAFATDSVTALFPYGMGQAAWTAAEITEAAGIAVSSAAATYTLASGTWDIAPAIGKWVFVKGTAVQAANVFQRVEDVATGSGSSTFVGDLAVGTSAGSGDETVDAGAQLLDGTAVNSIAFHRRYQDIAQAATLTGCVAEGFNIECTGNEFINCSFDWIGKTSSSGGTLYGQDNAQLDQSALAVSAMGNSKSFVRYGAYNVAGSGHTALTNVIGWTVSAKNNFRKQYQLGTLGAADMKLGDFEVTGTLQMYFENSTMFDLFLNQTASGLAIGFTYGTTTGQSFIIDIPSVKFTDGQRVAGGKDTDIIADMSWQGLSSTIGNNNYTMSLNHFDH